MCPSQISHPVLQEEDYKTYCEFLLTISLSQRGAYYAVTPIPVPKHSPVETSYFDIESPLSHTLEPFGFSAPWE